MKRSNGIGNGHFIDHENIKRKSCYFF